MTVHLLIVDLQHEFASPHGRLYRPRACVPFLIDTVFPTAMARSWSIHQVLADYRDPSRPPSAWHCAPGTWAGTSLVPAAAGASRPWYKATPSPAWTRDGAGQADASPGPARPDPDGFSQWLHTTVGPSDSRPLIVAVGLMLEVCVLSTLQELSVRGYRPQVLLEGIDTFTGNLQQKQALSDALCPFWGTAIHWDELLETTAASSTTTS